MNLIQLGWHQALGAQAAFAPLAEAGFCVGRIAQEQRHRYQVYTAEGELPALVTGHLRHHTEQLEDFPLWEIGWHCGGRLRRTPP